MQERRMFGVQSAQLRESPKCWLRDGSATVGNLPHKEQVSTHRVELCVLWHRIGGNLLPLAEPDVDVEQHADEPLLAVDNRRRQARQPVRANGRPSEFATVAAQADRCRAHSSGDACASTIATAVSRALAYCAAYIAAKISM